eukprot:COSAG02_NODE_67542_length_252_cov_1.692810_1_plen_26_part_01
MIVAGRYFHRPFVASAATAQLVDRRW